MRTIHLQVMRNLNPVLRPTGIGCLRAQTRVQSALFEFGLQAPLYDWKLVGEKSTQCPKRTMDRTRSPCEWFSQRSLSPGDIRSTIHQPGPRDGAHGLNIIIDADLSDSTFGSLALFKDPGWVEWSEVPQPGSGDLVHGWRAFFPFFT